MQKQFKQPLTIAEIATMIGAQIMSADPSLHLKKIYSLASIEDADPESISFLSNQLYKKHLTSTKAGALVLTPEDAKECPAHVAALCCKNPRLALAKILTLWQPANTVTAAVHPTAVLGNNLKLGKNIAIGPNCVIGDDTELDDDVVLGAGVIIGARCNIGAGTQLKPNVTLYDDVCMGQKCVVHSGTVIGSDGFGYELDENGGWFKLLHLGGVVIGNHVGIGSNTCIDRGLFDNTVIGNQVIIDNLVQIAHNVNIGDGTAIAGCVGIAGSTTIGKYCLIGGASSIVGHISISDRVYITGTSSVSHSITKSGVYSSGFPARENKEWRRNVARFMYLDDMAKRIKELEKTMAGPNE